jgi:NADH dehydrogenase
VATLFGLNFKGFLAWLVWLGFHLISLIGFRNRVVVLVNWINDYLFFGRKLRLITGETHPTPTVGGDPDRQIASGP